MLGCGAALLVPVLHPQSARRRPPPPHHAPACRTVARFVGKVQLILEGLEGVPGLDTSQTWQDALGARVRRFEPCALDPLPGPAVAHASVPGVLPFPHPLTGHTLEPHNPRACIGARGPAPR